jgi:hypothetical protein
MPDGPCLRARYDNGGFSGGNTERPALQRLWFPKIPSGQIRTLTQHQRIIASDGRDFGSIVREIEVATCPEALARCRGKIAPAFELVGGQNLHSIGSLGAEYKHRSGKRLCGAPHNPSPAICTFSGGAMVR